MELETDPREDSIRLTNAFHNQLRSSRDDFLLNGEELTLDHVNRLSTEPEDQADMYQQDSQAPNNTGVTSPIYNSGEDLLALDSEDAENWLVPSPGPSTASLTPHTGSQTPEQEASARSLDSAPSKRARTQAVAGQTTPASTRAVMQTSSTPASASSTARGPVSALGRPASSSAHSRRKQTAAGAAGEAQKPDTPDTPDSQKYPPSRIPKPSPTYSSPHKPHSADSSPSPYPPSRLPRPPTPPDDLLHALPARASSTAASTAPSRTASRAESSASSTAPASGRGSMKPARDYSGKFSEMWGPGGQDTAAKGRAAPKRSSSQHGDTTLVEDDSSRQSSPTRIPKPPTSPTKLPARHAESQTADDAAAAAAAPGQLESHAAGPNAVPDDEAAYAHQAHHLTSPQVEAILADTMDSSDNSDIIILSTADHDRLTMDAARQGMGMSTGAGASGRPISSERPGSKPWHRGGSGKGRAASKEPSSPSKPPWHDVCPPASRHDDVDIYVPKSQRSKEFSTSTVDLLHQHEKPSTQRGVFTQVMEGEKPADTASKAPVVGPMTAAHGTRPESQSHNPGNAVSAGSAGGNASGVGSQKLPEAAKAGTAGGKQQKGCCGCTIM